MNKKNYQTTDIGIIAYLFLRGHPIKEIKSSNGRLASFVSKCELSRGQELEQEYIESEFLSYYNATEQVRWLLNRYKDRETLDK